MSVCMRDSQVCSPVQDVCKDVTVRFSAHEDNCFWDAYRIAVSSFV